MARKPKRLNLPTPGKCIFCTKSCLTKEHLFADWLRADFHRTSHDHHTFTSYSWEPTPNVTSRIGQGHSGSKKMRRLCADCNSVWSSGLDDKAKGAIRPLYQGQTRVVTADIQQAISTWLVKIAMVGDSMRRERSLIPQAERTWMLNNSMPPNGYDVWIGSYEGGVWSELGIFQHGGTLKIPPPIGGPNVLIGYAKLTVIGIGKLLALVLSTEIATLRFYLRSTAQYFRQIWPIQHPFDWPSSPILTEDQASGLPQMFSSMVGNTPSRDG